MISPISIIFSISTFFKFIFKNCFQSNSRNVSSHAQYKLPVKIKRNYQSTIW